MKMAGLGQLAAFLLFHAGRTAGRVVNVTDYLGAGARRIADLKQDSVRMWRRFYEAHPAPEARLLPWETEVADRFVADGSDVLIIGCGGGRDVQAFAERHCRVTGLDPVDVAIGQCRRRLDHFGISATLTEAFFEDVDLSETFDTVVFSYYCYAAVPERARRLSALRKAAALLKPGGHIVVSHAGGVARSRGILVALGRLAGRLSGSDWRLEAGDIVWNNRGNAPAYSYTHAFLDGEAELEASAANLRVEFRHVAADCTVVLVLRPA